MRFTSSRRSNPSALLWLVFTLSQWYQSQDDGHRSQHTGIGDIVLFGLQRANGQRYECLDIPPCREVRDCLRRRVNRMPTFQTLIQNVRKAHPNRARAPENHARHSLSIKVLGSLRRTSNMTHIGVSHRGSYL